MSALTDDVNFGSWTLGASMPGDVCDLTEYD